LSESLAFCASLCAASQCIEKTCTDSIIAMPKVLNFYVDDSGTRHPDRPGTSGSKTRDWFALGGVLIREADEGECRRRFHEFRDRWGLSYALHSADIRHHAGSFRWLNTAGADEQERFMRDLTAFLLGIPAIGLACVIDRPGYNARYKEQYGSDRWKLCKTAFAIAAERGAKYALSIGHKLNVYVERCNEADDKKVREYFKEMKTAGLPFNAETSKQYGPLSAEQLQSVLYDLKIKQKTSPGVQIADLYLWPMCMGGYHKSNKPYKMLLEAGKLMDVICDRGKVAELGIKYSCFDLVKPQP
jgi:hypothetical protein